VSSDIDILNFADEIRGGRVVIRDLQVTVYAHHVELVIEEDWDDQGIHDTSISFNMNDPEHRSAMANLIGVLQHQLEIHNE
jgi:hypothetical protein